MTHQNEATVLIVPGLRDHMADHWQTLLAQRLDKVHTVPPLDIDRLSCAARVEALQRALETIDGPVILVAHSAGVMMVTHWAQKYSRPIQGALLAAPADVESPFPDNYPRTAVLEEHGWLPIPRQKLPFPSIVAASTNDPLGDFSRVSQFAEDWGGELVNLGEVGHLNPASGFGEWPRAVELIAMLQNGQHSLSVAGGPVAEAEAPV
ncbi:RBBP9/YdeN family alpha/beta hydrolase [Microbulbifer harenosus]|uniref:Alpha/beta hydrolase n=1 Tax=Microbulbifer harenosus TaxID=2576840 RepID=A0ABY2ULK6_9GAMM|nr:alpha/beta fold hydrolase [Microbulbifer harenosus]TLM77344.1 alpha/beta hydrolase [Microbulbifer harenosus]